MVSFDAPAADHALIKRIAERALADIPIPRGQRKERLLNLRMDIAAVHCNGMPMRLEEWLSCPDAFNFFHDIIGITKHLDRKTGRLVNHFRPRFAVPERLKKGA